MEGKPVLDDEHDPQERDPLDLLARAAHEVYCEGLKDRGDTGPMLVPFDELPAHEREQNRATVRDIPAKLGEIGYVVTPRLPGDPDVTIPEEKVETLAELEHVRWTRAKLDDGWQYDNVRDNDARRHPALLPWKAPPEQEGARFKFREDELKRLGHEELSDDQKEKDRDLTRQIPRILAKANYTIRQIDPGADS
jgi:hypothetical protein